VDRPERARRLTNKTNEDGEEATMNGKQRNDKSGATILSSRRQIIQAGGIAVATAALASFPAPRVRAARPMKIGYVSPQTGPLAPFAATDRFVIASVRDLFKKQNRAIEIIVKDSQSSPARASDVAAELILRDKVSLVLAGAAPETDNPVSDQCEINDVPCISTVAPGQPWFFGRGGKPDKPFKWTYHFFWGLEDAIAAFIGMWRQLETNRIVGGVFANDADANAWGEALPPELRKNGFTFFDPGRFQTLTHNFSAPISAFKSARPHIITGHMIPPDFTTLWA